MTDPRDGLLAMMIAQMAAIEFLLDFRLMGDPLERDIAETRMTEFITQDLLPRLAGQDEARAEALRALALDEVRDLLNFRANRRGGAGNSGRGSPE